MPIHDNEKRNARRRELRKLRSGGQVAQPRMYNPGPWKTPAALITEPAPPPVLSRVDRAQVAAYGYAGALKLNFL